MAAQGDMSVDALRYLLDCHGECEHLDFKEHFDLDNDYGCSSFAKDVLGMKNMGGGYLVIGVRDKAWEYFGLKSRLPYDTKALRDKVRKCTGLDLELDIVQHEVFVEGTPKLFGLILVRSTTKKSKLKQAAMPSTDFKPGERWGIRRREIFVRSGDSTLDEPGAPGGATAPFGPGNEAVERLLGIVARFTWHRLSHLHRVAFVRRGGFSATGT